MERVFESGVVVLDGTGQKTVAFDQGASREKTHHVFTVSGEVNVAFGGNPAAIEESTHPFDADAHGVEFTDVVGAKTEGGEPSLCGPVGKVKADAGPAWPGIPVASPVGVADEVARPEVQILVKSENGHVLGEASLMNFWWHQANPDSVEEVFDLDYFTLGGHGQWGGG